MAEKDTFVFIKGECLGRVREAFGSMTLPDAEANTLLHRLLNIQAQGTKRRKFAMRDDSKAGSLLSEDETGERELREISGPATTLGVQSTPEIYQKLKVYLGDLIDKREVTAIAQPQMRAFVTEALLNRRGELEAMTGVNPGPPLMSDDAIRAALERDPELLTLLEIVDADPLVPGSV